MVEPVEPCKYKDCCRYEECSHYPENARKCTESYINNPGLLERFIKWIEKTLYEEKPCIDHFVDKNDGRRTRL